MSDEAWWRGEDFRDGRLSVSIEAALQWAFGVEHARLEIGEMKGRAGVDPICRMQRMAELGATVDTSPGQAKVADDAERLAEIVALMPDSLGGARMARRVASLARSMSRPDWMPGAVPHCEPVRRGGKVVTETVRVYRYSVRQRINGKQRRIKQEFVGKRCPIVWGLHPDFLAEVRAEWCEWRAALDWTREAARAKRFDRLRVNAALPPDRPWQTGVR